MNEKQEKVLAALVEHGTQTGKEYARTSIIPAYDFLCMQRCASPENTDFYDFWLPEMYRAHAIYEISADFANLDSEQVEHIFDDVEDEEHYIDPRREWKNAVLEGIDSALREAGAEDDCKTCPHKKKCGFWWSEIRKYYDDDYDENEEAPEEYEY